MDRRVTWSDLPPEILQLISQRLSCRLYVLRFRAVCRSWRSSCPLASKANLLSNLFPRALDGLYHLTASIVYLFEPAYENLPQSSLLNPRGWLVTVDELNPGKLFLRHPLSKFPVTEYPENFPKVLNLLDFRVTEISKSYAKNLVYGDKGFRLVNLYWNSHEDKTILFPERNFVSDSDNADIGFSLAFLGQEGWISILSLRDEKWTRVHDGSRFKIDDIVNYNGKIYGIDRRARIYIIDYESFEMTKIVASIAGGGGRRKRLVVSNGVLYLVVMQNNDEAAVCFKVYRLSEAEGKWIEVRSLGDEVFFIGSDCSFSFSAKTYPGFRGNCIFAFRNSFRLYHGKGNDDHWEIYHKYRPKLRMGMFHLEDGGSFGPMESCDVFWPPPSWLVPNTSASECSATQQASRNIFEALEGGPEANGGIGNFQNVAQVRKRTMMSGDGSLENVAGVKKQATATGDHYPLDVPQVSNQEKTTGDANLIVPSSRLCKGKSIVHKSSGMTRNLQGAPPLDADILPPMKLTSNESTSASSYSAPGEPTIAQCMDMVRSIPGITLGSSLWNYACNLLCKKEMRMVLVNQPTDELRLSWLKFNYSIFRGRLPPPHDYDIC